MAWDFTADSEKQDEIAKALNKAADDFLAKKKEMYAEIDSMGQYWVGEDYTLYKEGTAGYETALDDLADGIKMYGKHFENLSEGTGQLATELIAVVNAITGDNGSNGGASGSGTTPIPMANGNTGATGDTTGSNDSTGNNGAGGSSTAGSNGGGTGSWSSYEDAAAAGYPNIKTPQEFARGSDDIEKYGTYQKYLEAMYDMYVGNGTTPDNDGTGSAGAVETNGEQTSTEAEVAVVETYSSGDAISLNGKTYNYYAGYQKANGEVVHMIADNTGNLYYVDNTGSLQQVVSKYTDANGRAVESPATINSLNEKVRVNYGHGYSADVSKSLVIGDSCIKDSSSLSSSVEVSGNSSLGATVVGSGTTYVDNSNSIVSDGSLRESYNGVFEGTSVNGSTFVKATSMNDFSSYLKPNENGIVDVTIQIPQGADVQWDPSSGWGDGYDFETSNGPVYLRWDASANNGAGAYKMVDQYGNYTSTKEFTLDGFNTNHGYWK